VRIRIPPVDFALVVIAAALVAIGLARPTLRAWLGPQAPATALADVLWLSPIVLWLRLLWAAAALRATGWRRAAARGVVCVLGGAVVATVASVLFPDIPRAITLERTLSLSLACACAGLGLAAFLTSPARRLPRPPRRP
jgi:hypothetical protein